MQQTSNFQSFNCILDAISLQNNTLLQQLLNSLYEGVLIVDSEGIVLYTNHAYSRITGEQASAILNKPVLQTDPDAHIVKALSSHRSLRDVYREINGCQFISDMSPIFNGSELIGAIAIVHDCTEILEKSRRISDRIHPIANDKSVAKGFRAYHSFEDISGNCEAMKKVKQMAKRVATSDVPVLLTGESGTGKELFAHAIHNYSDRSHKPFVAINCAAFSPTLLQSELFGYEDGSFTGATKGGKAGLFELAGDGTIFLDEIGEMEYELQAKLLRVLETGEFMRIGGTKNIRSKVRFISATNQNLPLLVSQKRFRADLWFRLNTASITVPPLRERGSEDIRQLVDHYLAHLNTKLATNCTISEEALSSLFQYSFPGNVRELINILQYAILSSDSLIESTNLSLHSLPSSDSPYTPPLQSSGDMTSAFGEKERLLYLLKEHGRSVAAKREVAAKLDISLATLYNRMKEYGIPTTYR